MLNTNNLNDQVSYTFVILINQKEAKYWKLSFLKRPLLYDNGHGVMVMAWRFYFPVILVAKAIWA